MILFGLLGYFSVKFLMWIVEHKIENKQKKLYSISASNLGVAKAAQTFSLRPPEAQSCTMYASESRLEVASVTK